MSHSSVVAEAEIETMSQVPLGGLAYETRNFRGAPGVMSGLARPVGLHSPPLAVDSQGLLDIGGCNFCDIFQSGVGGGWGGVRAEQRGEFDLGGSRPLDLVWFRLRDRGRVSSAHA